jgi:XTP/dITP diphosphohydrolase
MRVVFVSSNSGKAEEAEKIIPGLKWLKADVREESTSDLKQAAKSKARHARALVEGSAALVEDTGLFFDAYPGFPGVNTRFVLETIGLRGCLALLNGKGKGAEFRTVACLHDGETHFFEGVCRGRIVEPSGEAREGVGYDSVFVPDGATKTFAEMSLEEKQGFSHRRKAFEKVGEWVAEKN